MQNDKLNNEKLVLVPIPIMDNSGFSRGRDMTFITHHHHYGNMGNNMIQQNGVQQLQLMAMQQALLSTQSLLLEQKRALIQEASQLMLNEKNTEIKAIEGQAEYKTIGEDREDNKVLEYEIINDDQQKNEDKTNIKENKMNGVDDARLKEMFRSIERQISSNNEPPYFLKGCVNGTKENTIITAPVIFTIRNNIWRDRVRYVMKEYFLDNRTNILKRENNQENDNMAIVILNDSSTTPAELAELLVIYQVPIVTYLYTHNDNNLINQVFKKNIVHKLVTLLIDSFNLSSLLDRYFILGEPEINNDKVPFVLNNSDSNVLADLIKIKPVLSFGKKEQYVAIKTYQDFICPVELV